jgi:hypothetical protein
VNKIILLCGLLALPVLAASCGPDQPRAPAHAERAADCSGAASDSARAVCVALDSLARGERLPSRVHAVMRTAQGFCVQTLPADPSMVDGTGVIHLDQDGRIRSLAVVDSGGCGPPAPGER